MVFSSISFLFLFLPITIVFNKILRTDLLKNIFLVLVSLLFYFWGEGEGIVLLIFMSIVNLVIGKVILNVKKEELKKGVLIAGILFNASILIFYKCFIWVLVTASNFLQFSYPKWMDNVTMPLGVSFFTFHAISYLVDLYGEKIEKHSSIEFLTYIVIYERVERGL